MPKKKRQSVDSVKRQPKAPSKKRLATQLAESKVATAKEETQTYSRVTDSVIERIRSMVTEHVQPPNTSPASTKTMRSDNAKSVTTPPTASSDTPRPTDMGVTAQHAKIGVSPRPAPQKTDLVPDSYEIPFDVDDYLREKEEAPKLHLNRVQERTASPSSRGWVLVHMSQGEFPQKKLKCGLQLYWQVPHDIGKMYLGDHVFLCQSGIHPGIIGHGYVADLPTIWGDVHRSRIVHNVKKPNTHTHVIGVRVISAHQRLEYPVMRSLPLVSTINIPTMHIPYRQPLTTEQTFALLELWYM
jgi:hypothetical protein